MKSRPPFVYRHKKPRKRVKLSKETLQRIRRERLAPYEVDEPADEVVIDLLEQLRFVKECERQIWKQLAEYLARDESIRA